MPLNNNEQQLINDYTWRTSLIACLSFRYWSDYKDALSLQCIAAFTFLYFACLTPLITFGGLLGEATENRLGTMESLCSGFLCGIVFGLFAGQPMTILGSTGPVLVFENVLYDFCK